MSARSPTARLEVPLRSVPTTPVPPSPRVTSSPHSASLCGNDVAGARLFESQFGVGVKIAADLLDFGTELDDAIDQLHEFFRGTLRRMRSINFTRVLLESPPDEQACRSTFKRGQDSGSLRRVAGNDRPADRVSNRQP